MAIKICQCKGIFFVKCVWLSRSDYIGIMVVINSYGYVNPWHFAEKSRKLILSVLRGNHVHGSLNCIAFYIFL